MMTMVSECANSVLYRIHCNLLIFICHLMLLDDEDDDDEDEEEDQDNDENESSEEGIPEQEEMTLAERCDKFMM